MQNNSQKVILFADNAQDIRNASRLVSNNSWEGVIITDCFDFNTEDSRIKKIHDYSEMLNTGYFNILNAAQGFICSLNNINISGNVLFREYVSYKGVSLVEMSIQYFLAELVPFFKDVHLFEKIVDYEKPHRIIIFHDITLRQRLLKSIGLAKGAQVTVIGKKKYSLKRDVFMREAFFLHKRMYRFLKSCYFKLTNYFFGRRVSKKSPVFIFVNYIARNLDAILPVIKQYSSDERIVINYLASGCEKRLRSEKVSFKQFYGYKFYPLYNKRVEVFIKQIWHIVNNDPAFKSACVYKGVNIYECLLEIFAKLFFRIFPEEAWTVDVTMKIIRSHNTRALIITDQGMGMVLVAKKLGIPTVSIIPSSPGVFEYYGLAFSDYFVSTGLGWEKNLIKLGVRPEQICVTGPTKFDTLLGISFDRGNILDSLGLKHNQKTVLYVTAYLSAPLGHDLDNYLYEIRMVYRALSKIPETNVITKMHPCENNAKVYKKIALEEGCKNMVIVREYTIWKLIHVSDVVISNFSTASYDSVLLDKPVILFCLAQKFHAKDPWNLHEYNAAVFLNDFSELEDKIRAVLGNQDVQEALRVNRRNYLQHFAWPLDGKSSIRVKEFISAVSSAQHNNSLKRPEDELLCVRSNNV